jgi:hypothetical protein
MDMKKLVVDVALESFALIGVVAALPVILPMWADYQPNPGGPIDSAMRRQAVAALAVNVTEDYVFPDKATPIAALLNQRLRNGDYDAIADGAKLAVLPDIAAAPADGMRVATAYLLRSELNNVDVRPLLPAQ